MNDVASDIRGACGFAIPESGADVGWRGLRCDCGGHDRIEDRQSSAVAMRGASGPDRRAPHFRHGEIQEPPFGSDRRRGNALGGPLSDRSGALRDCPWRMVRHRAFDDRRCRRAHDLHLGHHGICGGRRRPRLRTPMDFPSADSADLRTDGWGDGADKAVLTTLGWRFSPCCISLVSRGSRPDYSRFFSAP